MMKLGKVWMLTAVLVLLLAACGGEAAPEPVAAPTDAPEVEEAVAATEAPPATLPPPVVEEAVEAQTEAEEEAPAPEPTAAMVEEEAVVEEVAVGVPDSPWPAEQFGYGVQVHGNATVGDPNEIMGTVRNQLGMDWVKVQVQWFVVEREDRDQWFFYDAVVENANKNGVRLLLSVVAAPEWTRASDNHQGPPDDYQNFANFLNKLIDRYPGQIDGIEVWNEQNLDREWQTANGVNPEDYVRFLELAYNTIKAKDPNIIVLSGALAPTGGGDFISWADDFAWLDRALAAGMLNFTDCVGAHHNGYNIGPTVTADQAPNDPQSATSVFRGPFDNPHHSWSFKTTLDTYAAKVQAVDPNMKLCVTEFGWASNEGYDIWPEGFEFARDNTLEEQADFLVQAFQEMHASGNVWLAFVFNYDFGNKGSGPTDDPVPYSIIDANGVPRPAFGALAEMEKVP
ncbi:MAG: hypothetical protein AAF614_18035 [Chloroflexota bacterium]